MTDKNSLPGASVAHLNRGASARGRTGALHIIRTQSCGDCDGKGTVFMLAEEYHCPSCCGDAFEEQCIERRINPGMR